VPVSRDSTPTPGVAGRPARDPFPGLRAPLGRRVLTVLIDWLISTAVSVVLFDWSPTATLAVFAGLNVVLLTLVGATPGQLVLGLRVVSVAGRLPMILRALIRTALLCLIIPVAIVDDADRGLHDRAAGTAVRLPDGR
jgi:uncharacterized RDD family membrane protein YckC